MKKIIPLLLAVFTLVNLSHAQNMSQKGTDIDGEAAEDESGWSVSMPDAHTVAIGAYLNDGSGINAGHVRIYTWNGSAWTQKGTDIDGEASNDRSGWSVSMPDPNTVAIGAYLNDGSGLNSGHVRIYTWSGSAWTQKGSDIEGESADDRSGWSVSMPDSNTVAIGAYQNGGNGNDAGHVRVFTWIGSVWIQKGGDIDGEAMGDLSGQAVSMPDANTVAIGATRNDGTGNDAGHVRIYTWSGNAWIQRGDDIDGEAISDRSGHAVSMPDASTVAIGAWGNDGSQSNAGHVRIYTWSGSAWTQKGADIDGVAADDESGYSVSMPDANTIAIGAHRNDGNELDAGQVRIYTWDGNAWTQRGNDILGEATVDQAGVSVSMPDANTVAIGARYNDATGSNAGHTRVYATGNVGIAESNFGSLLTVYPNPAKGEVHIDLGRKYTEATVIVTNTLGQAVLKKGYRDSDLLQLSLPGEAGLYFIEVRSGEKKALLKVMKE